MSRKAKFTKPDTILAVSGRDPESNFGIVNPPVYHASTVLYPTSDKLRETLFNILGARIPGARVLDGYAGTGAVGLEAHRDLPRRQHAGSAGRQFDGQRKAVQSLEQCSHLGSGRTVELLEAPDRSGTTEKERSGGR